MKTYLFKLFLLRSLIHPLFKKTGTVFHTANMILAAMRLSTFSEACGENTESHFSLKAFASKIREISLVPQQQQNRPMTLSQALISQGKSPTFPS